ncbi:MAG: hypothetical protein M1816_002793 [Peltula sp. TS41687]|nr:MAG: hypothetical protein M1816_002793 [Peltula sp. TS41687]
MSEPSRRAEGKSLGDGIAGLTISVADPAPDERDTDENLCNITDQGDLILVFTGGKWTSEPFRVDSERLRTESPYFDALLGNDRFKEGALLRDTHRRLREEGIRPSEARASKLPRITIAEMARLGPDPDHFIHEFLRILHGLEFSRCFFKVNDLACLASLADGFCCVQVVIKYVKERGLMRGLEGKFRKRSWGDFGERSLRQRILVGWLFTDPACFREGSCQLIMTGSRYWSDVEDISKYDQRLWWRLPDGIEDELQFRRECILETIDSLQRHLISLYTSGQRQCSLGYDNSPQCDSFQLGEAIRFFKRIGTVRLQGLIDDPTNDPSPSQQRSIQELIQTMRQCPSYQIDRNHSHCGIRAKLIPRLQKIESALAHDIGLNRDHWRSSRAVHSWSKTMPIARWSMPQHHNDDWWVPGGPNRRGSIMTFFTATTKDWT